MDPLEYNTFWEAVRNVPDPRRARGRRYSWEMILAILCTGLASGHKTIWAISHWAALHRQAWVTLLPGKRDSIPSAATLYRAIAYLDIGQLEAHLGSSTQRVPPEGPPPARFRALAVDGKELRGASQHEEKVHLISLVDQEQGVVVRQLRVRKGTNEQGALLQVLQEQPLQGTVLTMDAMYTTRPLAKEILQQGGHYLMVVKENQPALLEALETLFQSGALPQEQRFACHTYDRIHGRQEWRQVVASDELNHYLDWPGLGQVLARTCRRKRNRDEAPSTQTRYAVTSLSPQQASAQELAQLWRGHWVIENQIHYVRDETLGEDRNQMRRGNGPQALAALRNGLLNVFRQQGCGSIPQALRIHAAHLAGSLQSLGILPAQRGALQDLPTS